VNEPAAAEAVLLIEDIGSVRRLTMNRPKALNALNGGLMSALMQALEQAAEDDAVRVLILRGAGRAFCAGYDLNEDAAGGAQDSAHWYAELKHSTQQMLAILDHPKPVIASVHSYCLAGGTDLMLACDLAVSADDAYYGYVDIRFGSGAVSMFLPWVVGVRTAKELLFTGEDRVPADEALRLGLVNRVVARDDLDAATLGLAEEIAKNEPFVVQMMKRSLNRAWDVAGFRAAMDANTELAWRDARYRGEA
jgi:enoyl-CoA hydratase